MPQVTTAEDVNLYYEVFGLGDPLIFIHGLAADHLVFADMPKYFEDNYEVYLIDNRGSGRSDCPADPYTVSTMADDVVAFCKRLELKRCHFVGHSLGGMILQQLCYRYPEYVRSAVLCNTNVKVSTRYSLTAKARLELMRANASPEALIENGMGWTFSSRFLEQPGIIEKIIETRMANPFPISIEGYRNQLNALLTFDSSTWVQQIKNACLVIGSNEDIITFETDTHQLAANIPDAQYHAFSGVGHAPFIEQPEAFSRLLNAFITSNRD